MQNLAVTIVDWSHKKAKKVGVDRNEKRSANFPGQ